MAAYPHIFISYARQDGEDLARDLRQRLLDVGLTAWQDRTDMEGGRNWWQQITEALDHVDFMVLVATPGALASPYVRREWQYARQQGVCIYPAVMPGQGKPDFEGLPNWMRKVHFYDLAREWDKFLAHLRSPCQANRVPFMAPEITSGYIERPHEYEQMIDCLLADDGQNPVATCVALRGPGGFGKTTLAAVVCHDDRIITAFDEGVLWVTLGEQPDLLLEVTRLYRAITGERTANFIDVEEASQRLSEKLHEMDCLLVIDDVWQTSHVQPFMRGGERCARLITTRNFEVATRMADYHVEIDQMRHAEAVQLLLSRLEVDGGDLTPWRDLARRLGDWPLLLELVSDSLRSRLARGDSLAGALSWVNKALDRRGVEAFDRTDSAERHRAVSRTLEVSLELLSAADRARYLELVVFPEDEDIPLSAACALWGLDEFDTEALIQRLFDLSLLKFDLQAGTFRLHDVLRAYLREQLADEAALHQRLAAGWGDLYALPDTYAWRWIGFHLQTGQQMDKLRSLLLDFDWLNAKLLATDPNALQTDFERVLTTEDDTDLRLVQSALRNATHILVHDTTQLAGQLIGRLLAFDSPAIQGLLEGARQYRAAPWLEPLAVSLPQAGGPLLRTIQAHPKNIAAVKVLADGRRAVSSSSDGTIKLWSLGSGAELAVFDGHDGKKVNGLALTPDGQHLISAGSDYTLQVWNLAQQAHVRTLNGHTRPVSAAAVTPDGGQIVSASSDGTLGVWDFESGERVQTLTGHEGIVMDVAVSPDGRWIASGAADKTVRLWERASGQLVHTWHAHDSYLNAVLFSRDGQYVLAATDDGYLTAWAVVSGAELIRWQAHPRGVHGLALSPDGGQLLTASADLTLRVWAWPAGEQLAELTGHTWPVNAVDVGPDGDMAVSASADRTLKVWRLDDPAQAVDAHGHAERINSLTITPDGHYALSAASDDSLRVWTLDNFSPRHTLQGHLKRVNAVIITPNGRYGVSAASDGFIKVWDFVSGTEIRAFRAHKQAVNTLAITPDGKRVISGSSDGTLKVWNLASGLELQTLSGHRVRVGAVAVTPDGQRIVSAAGSYYGRQHDLAVWDIASGQRLARWQGHDKQVNALVITPDGQQLITASDDKTAIVWELASQEAVRTLHGHTERINAVAISPDGTLILTAGDDGRLIVWARQTGQRLATFNADDALFACAIGPNQQTLAAGGSSGRVHFLRLHRV